MAHPVQFPATTVASPILPTRGRVGHTHFGTTQVVGDQFSLRFGASDSKPNTGPGPAPNFWKNPWKWLKHKFAQFKHWLTHDNFIARTFRGTLDAFKEGMDKAKSWFEKDPQPIDIPSELQIKLSDTESVTLKVKDIATKYKTAFEASPHGALPEPMYEFLAKATLGMFLSSYLDPKQNTAEETQALQKHLQCLTDDQASPDELKVVANAGMFHTWVSNVNNPLPKLNKVEIAYLTEPAPGVTHQTLTIESLKKVFKETGNLTDSDAEQLSLETLQGACCNKIMLPVLRQQFKNGDEIVRTAERNLYNLTQGQIPSDATLQSQMKAIFDPLKNQPEEALAEAQSPSINVRSKAPAAPKNASEFQTALQTQFKKGHMDSRQKAHIQGLITELKQYEAPKDAINRRLKEPISEAERQKLTFELLALAEHPSATLLKKKLSDILVNQPWQTTQKPVNLANAINTLNANHYGLEQVKEQIEKYLIEAEYLRKHGRTQEIRPLLLVGPPGCGKTTLVQSIAQAMGRNFADINMAQVTDAHDMTGSNALYQNANQGTFFKKRGESGAMDSLLFLDEIDKMGGNSTIGNVHGNPADVLLAMTDPKRNKTVEDKFTGLHYDLSHHFFVMAANQESKLTEELGDRVHKVYLPGYLADEKREMTQSHLLDKLRKNKALSKEQFDLTVGAIDYLIENYTPRAAGVRKLEESLENLAQEVIKGIETQKPIPQPMNEATLTQLLGTPLYTKQAWQPTAVGLVKGLYATSDGNGGVGVFEAVPRQIEAPQNTFESLVLAPLANNLGKSTADSIHKGFAYVAANQARLATQFNNGSAFTPKGQQTIIAMGTERGYDVDGDSAGSANVVSLVSSLTQRAIKESVAITGTITTTGKVQGVGGIAQKLMGAMTEGQGYLSSQGVKVVFVPWENRNDLQPDRLSPSMFKKLQVYDLTQNGQTEPTGNCNAQIEAAQKEAQQSGKLLVVLTNRIEPILHYTLT